MKLTVSWSFWGAGALCAVLAGCVAPPSSVVEIAVPEPELLVPVAAPPALTVAPPPLPLAGPPHVAAPRADPREVVDAAVTAPVIRQRRYPDYPSALVEEGIEGLVITAFFVDVDGKPEDIRVERSPHPLLSRAAADSLKGWRFDPARAADGRAVRARMRLPFRFRLE